jgi:hypothetical protein
VPTRTTGNTSGPSIVIDEKGAAMSREDMQTA